ncbi:class I SAM-dependent methyltransferase [Laspinema sp. D1]|uniref:methyltransferase domain-containing protein n=1 Tax=Laspinema palackyanum TaxID=3231601 RepID=UPI00347588BA|nr:class I SAM-dependent methyltransferase [Laspinema sp. D2b]
MLINVKQAIPWWIKIISKVILSRLPISYNIWKQISLFKHGEMGNYSYAYQVFKKHFIPAELPENFTTLEIGPGDSLFSGLISKALGGELCYLIDVGDYANKDQKRYQEVNMFLVNQGLKTVNIENCNSFQEILDKNQIIYLTEGLKSLKTIPSNSVDFIFSQAVLEHIRRNEFLDVMKELRRIIKNTGYCSHMIDLKDHLGGNLNNLRFYERIWELDFMVKSGFYTNRIRYSEMIDLFQEANFQITSIEIKKWDKLPTSRKNLAFPFRNMPDEELLVSEFSTILHPV